MDSREIFNRARKKLEWEDNWIHVGTGKGINTVLVCSIISNHFGLKNDLMLKRGRRDSQSIDYKLNQEDILELIGNEDFELWDEDFKKAVKFNKMGVMIKSKNAI